MQHGGTRGDVSSEVTVAANIFAQLGLSLNLRPPSVNGANTGTENIQSNTMHLSKEHVVEVKEEDERRTSPDVSS